MPHPAIRPSLLGSSELLRIKQKDFKALCKVSPKAALSVNVVAEEKGSCHLDNGIIVKP